MWTLLAAAVAVVACVYWLAYNPITWWSLRKLPSPPRLPFLGHLLSIQSRTLHGFSFESFSKYGPIYTLWWGRRAHVVVSDPASCRKVISHFQHRAAWPAPLRSGPDLSFYNDGIIFAKDLSAHKTMRATWAPHFSPLSLAAYHPLMTDAIQRLVAYLEPLAEAGQPLDIHYILSCLTMEVTGRAAFGIDIDGYPDSTGGAKSGAPAVSLVSAEALPPGAAAASDGAQKRLGQLVVHSMRMVLRSARPSDASAWVALYVMVPEAVGQVVAALAKMLPDASWKRLLAAQDSLRHVAHTLVANDRATLSGGAEAPQGRVAGKGLDPGSFIKYLVSARNKDGGAALSDSQLDSNIVSFMAAGFDTSANQLAFALHFVATHPEVEAKLTQEVDAFGPADRMPSLEDLAKFPYVAAVVDESLRLKPTGALLIRKSDAAINLHGYDIPAGTTIQLSVWNAHHNPAVWRDAERFVPERFLPGHPEWAAPEGHFMPFGGGSRGCIGSRFALNEMKLALVALYRRYTFRLAPGYAPLQLETAITTGPTAAIMVTAHLR